MTVRSSGDQPTYHMAAGTGDAFYGAAGAPAGRGRDDDGGDAGAPPPGGTYAETPELGRAVAAAGRAGTNIRAVKAARAGIEAALRDLMTAAQGEGRVLSAAEGAAFDAGSALSDELLDRANRAEADLRRSVRFGRDPNAAAPGQEAGDGHGFLAASHRPAATAAVRAAAAGGTGTLLRLGDGRSLRAFRHGEPLERYARASAGLAPDGEDANTFGTLVRCMATGAPVPEALRAAMGEHLAPSGGILAPGLLSSQVIDLARGASVVSQAGAQVVPMGAGASLTIAAVVRDPQPQWRAEHSPIAETEPSFAPLVVLPRSLACIVPVSLELLADALNVEAILRDLLAAAFAAELDRAALAGSGLAAEPRGVVNNNWVPRTLPTGDAGDVAHPDLLTRLLWGLRQGGAAGPLSLVTHPQVWMALDTRRTPTGELLAQPQIVQDAARLASDKLPQTGGGPTWASPVVAGDFSQMLLVIREQLQVEVNREASPYFNQGQVAVRAIMRADVVLTRPSHFIVREGVRIA